jgi:membrane protein required for colicin V production
MNGLDIALAVVLFFFFLRGIFRGFIKEIVGIVGLVVGFAVARVYYPQMADVLKPFLQNAAYRQTIGFLAVFIIVFFVLGLIGLLVDKLVKMTFSQVANGLLGALIVQAKGLILSSVILMASSAFIRADTPFYKDSKAWPYIKNFSEALRELTPKELQDAFHYKPSLLPDSLKPSTPGGADQGQTEQDDQAAPETSPWKPGSPKPTTPSSPAWPSSSGSSGAPNR